MNEDFLKKLQHEAQQQKKLYNSRIIPKAFDPITSYIGENTLLTLSLLAIISAIIVEVIKIVWKRELHFFLLFIL